jgi:hypothetical protein
MEDQPAYPAQEPAPPPPPALPPGPSAQKPSRSWVFILVGLVVLALIVAGIYGLLVSSPDSVGKIRDIFIIFLALESLITGIVLIVLVVQIALLINLLQNEIKPILESTNETVNTLKGTTTFLSNNLAAPVIKMNEYLAGLKKLLDLLFPAKH